MRLDAALPPIHLEHVPEIARAAEGMGFAALWSTETQHDPFLPHALVAEHTAKIGMGTAIAVAFARSPATVAYTAWDLAAQSNGRFILGLGTQVKAHIERRFGMPWPESPVGKMREQIEAIRAFWDCWQNNSRLNFRGEYYKLSLMSPFFNPGPLPLTPSPSPTGGGESIIPIYLAGVNTGLAKLAGELCDGFLVHPLNSRRYLEEAVLPAIRQGEKKGKDRHTDIAVTAFAASTPEEQNFCRAQVAFYASTPSYRPVMALHGWEEVAENLSALAARGEWGEMFGLVTDDILSAFCVTAPVEELAQALKERYNGIADRITLYIPFLPGERDGFWKDLIREMKE
ncbi:MAG: TIGR03617 family F420-dependent LLM class oxidoreductase [Chloroflexi bacterium]|nr:TIGR03617 family F420-dependent LLM class oxidoreductase [Chloroflexota bacterium]